jgi:hypothetical protein
MEMLLEGESVCSLGCIMRVSGAPPPTIFVRWFAALGERLAIVRD